MDPICVAVDVSYQVPTLVGPRARPRPTWRAQGPGLRTTSRRSATLERCDRHSGLGSRPPPGGVEVSQGSLDVGQVGVVVGTWIHHQRRAASWMAQDVGVGAVEGHVRGVGAGTADVISSCRSITGSCPRGGRSQPWRGSWDGGSAGWVIVAYRLPAGDQVPGVKAQASRLDGAERG